MRFLFLPNVQTGSWLHPASYWTGTGNSFPGGRAPSAWSWTLTPFSAEITNKWSYTSTHPMCLYGVDRDNFTFYQNGNLNHYNNSVDSDVYGSCFQNIRISLLSWWSFWISSWTTLKTAELDYQLIWDIKCLILEAHIPR